MRIEKQGIHLLVTFLENDVLTELINFIWKQHTHKKSETQLHYLKHIWLYCHLTNVIWAKNKIKHKFHLYTGIVQSWQLFPKPGFAMHYQNYILSNFGWIDSNSNRLESFEVGDPSLGMEAGRPKS